MPRLTVEPSRTHLLRDETLFPLIVDTVWESFAVGRDADYAVPAARAASTRPAC
jgi:hypothetical protein